MTEREEVRKRWGKRGREGGMERAWERKGKRETDSSEYIAYCMKCSYPKELF